MSCQRCLIRWTARKDPSWRSLKKDSVWEDRDLPVLVAAARACDQGLTPSVADLAAETGLVVSEVERSLAALELTGYLKRRVKYAGVTGVQCVTGKAYPAAGLHPNPKDLLERLAGALKASADETSDPGKEEMLRKASSAVANVATQISADLAARLIAAGLGMGA